MPITEIKSRFGNLVGNLHEIEPKESHSILVFQLPRATNMLNEAYIESAMKTIRESLPAGRKALIIARDVNIYELAEADSIILKLKGII